MLIKSLIDFKINHRNSENNFSLAYKLVKKLGNKLKAEGIEQYGVSIKYLTEKLTINQILTEIDEDIYKESEENFNTII